MVERDLESWVHASAWSSPKMISLDHCTRLMFGFGSHTLCQYPAAHCDNFEETHRRILALHASSSSYAANASARTHPTHSSARADVVLSLSGQTPTSAVTIVGVRLSERRDFGDLQLSVDVLEWCPLAPRCRACAADYPGD